MIIPVYIQQTLIVGLFVVALIGFHYWWFSLLMKLGKEANTVCSHCGSSRHTDRQCHVYHYAMKLTGQPYDERFLPAQVHVMTEEEFIDTLDQLNKVKKLADRG